MQYDEFIRGVMQAGRLDAYEEAEHVVDASLETLGEIMTAPERDRLSAQLPSEMHEPLTRRKVPREVLLENFYHMVGARAGLGYPEAVRQSRAVIRTLTRAVTREQWKAALAALPPEYEELCGGTEPGAASPTREGLSKADQGLSPVEPPSGADLLTVFKAEDRKILRVLEKLRDTSSSEPREREAWILPLSGRCASEAHAVVEVISPESALNLWNRIRAVDPGKAPSRTHHKRAPSHDLSRDGTTSAASAWVRPRLPSLHEHPGLDGLALVE
jgi:uncharacterized protein (DUF2267 family)